MIEYDDGKVRVRRSSLEDALFISENMREADVQEVWASDNLTPEEAIVSSFKASTICCTIENGQPIAMFGVVPKGLVGKSGTIWMLATDAIEKIKYKFLKYNRKFIGGILEQYPYLHNFVDARNQRSINWLRFCGAEIDPPEPYGAERQPFCYFSFEKKRQAIVNESLNVRQKTDILQKAMMNFPGAQIGDGKICPLKHTFCDGSYVREIFMPKGTLVVSKIHKKRHPYFIMSGDVSVVTEDGSARIKAPYQGITEPGTKRVLFTHEDTVWTTVHVTEKTDIKEIEQEIIADAFDDIKTLEVTK